MLAKRIHTWFTCLAHPCVPHLMNPTYLANNHLVNPLGGHFWSSEISVQTWNTTKTFQTEKNKMWLRAVVVSQLVGQSLPIPEVRGSNPFIGKFTSNIYCQLNWKDGNKEKEAGNGPFNFFINVPVERVLGHRRRLAGPSSRDDRLRGERKGGRGGQRGCPQGRLWASTAWPTHCKVVSLLSPWSAWGPMSFNHWDLSTHKPKQRQVDLQFKWKVEAKLVPFVTIIFCSDNSLSYLVVFYCFTISKQKLIWNNGIDVTRYMIYLLGSQRFELRYYAAVWPDLAKFCHLGII